LANSLESVVTDRGTEGDAELALPSSRQPRPKAIPEEVELLVRVVATPILILAIDDLCLFRMKYQPAFSKAPLKGKPQCHRLVRTFAMANCIIGIPLEGDIRMIPSHPQIEGIMEKKIR